jgi:hypothetical protein
MSTRILRLKLADRDRADVYALLSMLGPDEWPVDDDGPVNEEIVHGEILASLCRDRLAELKKAAKNGEAKP